jgi:hypothetical protein
MTEVLGNIYDDDYFTHFVQRIAYIKLVQIFVSDLHKNELRNLYSSLNIIRQIKSRRIRWAGHVARMGEERKVYKVLVGKPQGKETN